MHDVEPENITEAGHYDLGNIAPLRQTRGRVMLVSEHKRLLKALLARVETDKLRRGVIVTGQPGIGDSLMPEHS